MGNDLLNWGFCMAQETHPRSRGENETCAPERCPPYGSSPLTRGKHIMRRGWPTCPGITPRWAGCHPHAYRATIPRRTHPRSRREHTSNAIGIVRSAGSSLLTRGTFSPRQESEALLGIIPAHAGNTPSDLCKHHTAQADYGSTVERLSLSYSFYHTPTTKDAQLESLVRHRYERPQGRCQWVVAMSWLNASVGVR